MLHAAGLRRGGPGVDEQPLEEAVLGEGSDSKIPLILMPRMIERTSKGRIDANRNTMQIPTSTPWGTCQRSSAHMIADGESVKSAQPTVKGGTIWRMLTKRTP